MIANVATAGLAAQDLPEAVFCVLARRPGSAAVALRVRLPEADALGSPSAGSSLPVSPLPAKASCRVD